MSVYAQDGGMGTTSTPTLKTPMSTATRFGLKAGINLASLEPDNYPGTDVNFNNKTSFHAGVFANIPLGGKLRFQPELLYSSQGAKGKSFPISGGISTNSNEQDLGYIALPLMFQLQSTSGFVFELGPQASYLISGKLEGANDAETENESVFDRFDVAASGGVGYLSRVGLGINARYNFGLSNIINEGDTDDGPELKNRVFQIGLTYQFGANK